MFLDSALFCLVWFSCVRSKFPVGAQHRRLSTGFPGEYSKQYSELGSVFFSVFSQYPLALDHLKYIEKTHVSSATSYLTSASRPFSEYVAVKPRGRNSHCLMGDEREGPPRGQKGTRSKSYKCCPFKCLGAGQPDTPQHTHPQEVAPSIAPLGAALQLLGNHYLCWAFYCSQGTACQLRSCFCFIKRVPGAQGKKSYAERQETLKKKRKKMDSVKFA